MYGNYYGYGRSSSVLNSTSSGSVWVIVSLVLAIVGGLVLYFVFLNKKNEGKYTGFLAWMYDFLSFKKLFIEAFLKITYLILAIFITLSSFALIGSSFLGFLSTLIVGNIVVRAGYEFSLILLVICRNTTDINKKLPKDNYSDNDNENK